MLSVKHIVKSYKTGDFIQKALDDVSVKFRSSEFVCILGSSGSGKTTFLNIIGGLDKYDSGDLIINGKSTKRFKDRDWDSYRNNSVGFIFGLDNMRSYRCSVDLSKNALIFPDAGICAKFLSDGEIKKIQEEEDKKEELEEIEKAKKASKEKK